METPKELIDDFTQTYTELIQDICCYSGEDLPLTMWILEKDFRSVTNRVLVATDKKPNPFNDMVSYFTKDNAVAYVAGGVVNTLAHKLSGKTTTEKIDVNNANHIGICGTTAVDGKMMSIEDMKKDPNTRPGLLIVTSCVDTTGSVAEKPTKTIDSLALYNIDKDDNDVRLILANGDVPRQAEGDNTFINILGERFGLRRKC
tara:strand:+ start:157 stop:762 length:606 start_codon:yes stop_codon:yes gene_type:complete